jgi:hypothetical protein
MDFLRRLDPGRAAAPGAARLVVPPRWLEPATPPPESASERIGASSVPSATPLPHARVAAAPIEREHSPGRNPSPGLAESVRSPTPGPRRPAPDELARPRSVGPGAAPPAPSAGATPAVGSASQVDSVGLRVALARPHPPDADAGPRARAEPLPLVPTPSHAVPDRPLRADALAERRPRAASEPPVVHVTIDRIDVRLPAAVDASPSPRERRPRAASAVAPLSEYLRGGGRG